MGSVARFLGRAVAAHRQAAALLLDAEAVVQTMAADGTSGVDADEEQRRLTRQLNELVYSWLPGWLGRPLDDTIIDLPMGRDAVPGRPMYLRLGDAYTSQDSAFPAVAPFVGGGHLTIDTDARDPVVAAWLRGVLVRTLAALPDGTLRVLAVDGATLGATPSAFT